MTRGETVESLAMAEVSVGNQPTKESGTRSQLRWRGSRKESRRTPKLRGRLSSVPSIKADATHSMNKRGAHKEPCLAALDDREKGMDDLTSRRSKGSGFGAAHASYSELTLYYKEPASVLA